MSSKAKEQEAELTREKDEGWKPRIVTVEPAICLYFIVLVPGALLMSQLLISEVAIQKNYTFAAGGGYCAEEDNDTAEDTDDLLQEVQAAAARFKLWLDIADTVPMLIITMLLGSISDIVGRKPAMYISLSGITIKYTLIVLVQLLNLPMEVFFVAYFLDGITGSSTTMFTAGYSYISDIYTGHQRSFRMTLMVASFSFALAISQLYMGHFIEQTGFMWPCVFLSAICIINFVYVLCLPESLDKKRNVKKGPLVSLDHMRQGVRVILFPTIRGNRWKLISTLSAFITIGAMNSAERGVTSFFLMNSPLCWGSVLLGNYYAFGSLAQNIGQIVISKLCLKNLGEVRLYILGTLSGAASLLMLAFSTMTWMVFLSPVVGIASALTTPMLRSILPMLVPPYEIGALFAVAGVIEKLGGLAGDIMMTMVYAATLHFFKGFLFVVLAAGYMITVVIMTYYYIHSKKEEQEDIKSKPTTEKVFAITSHQTDETLRPTIENDISNENINVIITKM